MSFAKMFWFKSKGFTAVADTTLSIIDSEIMTYMITLVKAFIAEAVILIRVAVVTKKNYVKSIIHF